MRQMREDLTALIRMTVEPMGYELLGVEYLQPGGSTLLRIYIDGENGITPDDCAAVSHQVSGVLDVEDPIPGQYTLEVSSPGLDRPLFTSAHYQRFTGRRAKVRLREKLGGRRRFEGVLQGIQEGYLLLQGEEALFRLPLDQIESARLVPEL